MQQFFLKYPGEIITTDDFFDIKRIMDKKGTPLMLGCQVDHIYYDVNFTNGWFFINDNGICPADGDILLTDKNVEYRPIWFRRWYRTFKVGKGETGARWILFSGWQFTENGRNHKRMLQIHQDGTVGIG